MNEPRRRLLVAMFVPHALVEMRGGVQRCVEQGWDVDLLVAFEGATAAEVDAFGADHGIAVHRPPSSMIYGSGAFGGDEVAAWIRSLPRPIRRAATAVAVLRSRYTQMRERRKWAGRLLAARRPDVLLMHNFQSVGQLDRALLVEAKGRGIPAVCQLVSPMISRSIARRGRPNQYRAGMVPESYRVDHDLLNRVFGLCAPSWWVQENGPRLFLGHPLSLLAARLSGLAPRDIWQVPAEEFDRMLAPSRRSRDRLVADGQPEEKISVVGSARLHEAIALASDPAAASALFRELGVDAEEGFVLWNMEPALEHRYATAEAHWARVELLRDALSRLGRKIVISLHPLCTLETYRFLEEDERFVIARNYRINQLYPFCRFALSFGCSTDIYAETFGKVVVFYDWIGESGDRLAEILVERMVVERSADALPATLARVDASVAMPESESVQVTAAPAAVTIERLLAEAAKADDAALSRHRGSERAG